ALLRTAMQATPPVGALMAGFTLRAGTGPAVASIVAAMAVPALLLAPDLLRPRHAEPGRLRPHQADSERCPLPEENAGHGCISARVLRARYGGPPAPGNRQTAAGPGRRITPPRSLHSALMGGGRLRLPLRDLLHQRRAAPGRRRHDRRCRGPGSTKVVTKISEAGPPLQRYTDGNNQFSPPDGQARRRPDPPAGGRAAGAAVPLPRQGHHGHCRVPLRGRPAPPTGSASGARWRGWAGSRCT